MKITRKWEMPNKNTFSIKCINSFIKNKINEKKVINCLTKSTKIIDPFSNGRKDLANITNDLNEELEADFHLDALDFLKSFDNNSVDICLFDPPYSPRQVSECYKKLGKTVNMKTTQASYWSNLKKEIGRIISKNGFVISFGWNSGGIGKKYGFEIEEIMLVSHGGWHNDTICTFEVKRSIN